MLAACKKPIESNTDEEDDVIIYIHGTKTIKSKDLWSYRNEEQTSNLVLNTNNSIEVSDKEVNGIYESNPIEASDFSELVLTWNLKNLGDAQIAFFVAIGDGTNFGDFQMMGSFADEKSRSMKLQTNTFSNVSYDTLINNNSDEYKYIKLRFNITSNTSDDLYLENISVTTKLKDVDFTYDYDKLHNKEINVSPMQQLSVPNIGNVICSPTSVAMVVNYYGFDYSQEEMAKKAYDNGTRIYGNWTINASYAGSLKGIYSRVEHIHNFETVIDYINNDIPVVFSIKTTNLDQLTGSIMAFPAGHLIVLIGFEEIDGVWHGIFNDPAEYKDEKVLRKYPLEQVFNVWNKYTYVITNEDIL